MHIHGVRRSLYSSCHSLLYSSFVIRVIRALLNFKGYKQYTAAAAEPELDGTVVVSRFRFGKPVFWPEFHKIYLFLILTFAESLLPSTLRFFYKGVRLIRTGTKPNRFPIFRTIPRIESTDSVMNYGLQELRYWFLFSSVTPKNGGVDFC